MNIPCGIFFFFWIICLCTAWIWWTFAKLQCPTSTWNATNCCLLSLVSSRAIWFHFCLSRINRKPICIKRLREMCSQRSQTHISIESGCPAERKIKSEEENVELKKKRKAGWSHRHCVEFIGRSHFIQQEHKSFWFKYYCYLIILLNKFNSVHSTTNQMLISEFMAFTFICNYLFFAHL